MFFICLIQIPIGAVAWWVCMRLIPWAIKRATLTNVAWVGVQDGALQVYLAGVVNILHLLLTWHMK